MSSLDWFVVAAYLFAMLLLSALLGRGQQSRKDYYLGGQQMSPLSLATSTIATQCSTNSLLGAPAFVGFVAGGGMIWLQYELAVPLAMLVLIYLLSPIREKSYISVYAYLEDRLGKSARLVASSCFQIFRGIATGVTVYGVGLVVSLLLEVSYTQAVIILMAVTIAYDVMGGMKAVVISDVIQVLLIICAVVASLLLLIDELGGIAPVFAERTEALNFNWGVSADDSYGFWPMLLGGLFLYTAYYGCDQSQAQRVLAARSVADTRRVLVLNGVLRFPLVLLYCVLGLALAAYATGNDFVSRLPTTETGVPNFNLAYPIYVLESFPAGFIGLVMVGIFAAAMSSIDSALNSLSAATIEDYLTADQHLSERGMFIASKLATLGWGVFAVVFSYQVENIAPTVLEAINKISSMVNGPLLALFALALLAPGVGQSRAVTGFFTGLGANLLLWLFAPQISWLWWNVAGFAVTAATALLLRPVALRAPAVTVTRSNWLPLLGTAAIIGLACIGLQLL